MHYRYNSRNDFTFNHTGRLHNPAWSHVLTNGRLSCTVTDRFSGNLWYMNAREFRVTPWLNDPDAAHGPERMEIDGMSVFAANDGIPAAVTYGFGYASWNKRGITTTVRIDPQRDVRVITVEKRGAFALDYSAEFLLGSDKQDAKLVVIEPDGGGIRVRSLNHDEPSLTLRADTPATLLSEPGLTHNLRLRFTATDKLTLLCGFGETEPLATLAEVRGYWSDYCRSDWLTYQTLACRILARGSIYQSGGAYGFRDQLQDVCAVLDLHPVLAREHILRCCAHQYEQGDVMHWWHPARGPNPQDKGVRTRCSDDLLWLVYAVCEYVEATSDRALLDDRVAFISSEPLCANEPDRYEHAFPSAQSGTVLEHCERALQCVMERNSGCELLNIGGGDWNDGFSDVNGGSVWLTWFFLYCVSCFAALTCRREATVCPSVAKLAAAANASFNGSYFERAYYPDGTPLPILDSVAQSWAVLSGFGEPVKCRVALRTALDRLWDRKNKIVKLFDPPFDPAPGERSPGYISAYLPGVRENGGQYTHAAIWLAMACLKTTGFEAEGRQILLDLLPASHDMSVYGAEPFVLAADVYTNPEMYGRAGWSWYTGASGWYLIARRLAELQGTHAK